jgi:DNA-binding NtrC family response regulator
MSSGSPDAPHILLVDTESEEAHYLHRVLGDHGFDVKWAQDGDGALDLLDRDPFGAVVCELLSQRIDGLRVLHLAQTRNPNMCVVLLASDPGLEPVTEAMRAGAHDVHMRPVNVEKLLAVLDRGISHQKLVHAVSDLQSRLDAKYGFSGLVGRSALMIAVFERIHQLAPTRATILLQGETGTGKELVAQAIHQNSARKDAPFVKLHCAALAEGVIESELFGHERGAFTGALTARKGRFEIADGGTLLLDEIGEISPRIQTKLLRVLQEQEFERVGSSRSIRVDVRLIASTNRNLADMVGEGTFREDLYYRLDVVRIDLPPLRERHDDIPLLADAFVREANAEHGKNVRGLTRAAMDRLTAYPWPGNVRELRNCMEGMVVLAGTRRTLDVEDLPSSMRTAPVAGMMAIPIGTDLQEIERIAIEETLAACSNDKRRAARMLGIGLSTLYRKLADYGLTGARTTSSR